ncbi:MAG: hypothetical protein ABIP94_17440, partial [Planctomycetota bacterium]
SVWLPGEGLPGVGGTVYASTTWDPDGAGPVPPQLVVGGTFLTAGTTLANRIARWDPATGVWSALGAGVDGDVRALATMPNGDLVVAGYFASAGGVPASRIARWDGASWSALGAGFDDQVRALTVLPNGDLIAGGAFQTAGGANTPLIARWDGTSWSALGGGLQSVFPAVQGVWALTVMTNGDLIVGGTFLGAVGVAARHIARWNGTSWLALGAGLTGSVGSDCVYSLTTLPNGNLVAGGQFSTVGGAALHLALWDGVTWSALGSAINGAFNQVQVSALTTMPNGDLVASGTFSFIGGVAARHIARWNGSSWSALGAGMFSIMVSGAAPVYALTVLPSGELIAGGFFWRSGSVSASGVSRWDGANWTALAGGMDGSVAAMVRLANGDLVVGGSFRTAGGLATDRIARWDGTSWSPLGSGMDDSIAALAVLPNGDVVAGGFFTTAGGISASRIARWNGITWSPLGAGMNSIVAALRVLPNGDLIAGGGFGNTGGVVVNNIARWDGTAWASLGAGIAGWVSALDLSPNGDLVAGGSFAAAGGVSANCIARWNGVAWSALGSGINGSVRALVVQANGDLVASGGFNVAGAVSANNIARWDGATWWPLGTGLTGPPFLYGVSALAVLPNGDLMAGGSFNVGGVTGSGGSVGNLARWDGSAWSNVAAGTNGNVRSLLMNPLGELVVGGDFTVAGSNVSGALARLTTTCPALATAYGAGCTGSGGPNVLDAVTLPWLGSLFRTVATGFPLNSLALGVYGLGQVSIPLPSLVPFGVPGCLLLVSPDLLLLSLPNAGSVQMQLAIPGTSSLVGQVLNYQVVPVELDVLGNIAALTSTNALSLTIGSF